MSHTVIGNLRRVARIIETSSTASITRPKMTSGKGWFWNIRFVVRDRKGNTLNDLQYIRDYFDLEAEILADRDNHTLTIHQRDLVPYLKNVIPFLTVDKIREKMEILYIAAISNSGSRNRILPVCEQRLKQLNAYHSGHRKLKRRIKKKSRQDRLDEAQFIEAFERVFA